MSFFDELKRRNVFRVGAAYAVAAWVLLQMFDVIGEILELPLWGGKLILLALVIGFFLVLILAWFYELTPEGVKRDYEVDRSQSITPRTGQKLNRVTIALLGIAVAVLLADRFIPGERQDELVSSARPTAAAAAIDKSIAVLPFVNMSADPDNEYFSDGIAEEILNVLARIPELKVAARTSAFAYKGTNVNITDIGRDLRVSHVLEGSVRKSGDEVRVTAQLIRADNGYHLWSETYDRQLVNIFAIQDEIATSIADALKVTLDIDGGTAGNLTGTTNTDAYDAYLKGINQWHLRTGESLYNSIRLFEEAIALDPQFARAHAGLALTYAVIMDYTEMPPDQARARARQAAEAALAIDPGLVEAATALIYTVDDLEVQLQYAEQAIALNPSFATAHQWYATTLQLLGQLDAAREEYLLALDLDPRSRVINSNLAELYMLADDWEEAARVLERLLSWAPDYTYGMRQLFLVRLARGDRPGAAEIGRRMARTLGRTVDTTDLYLDYAFDPTRRPAVTAEVLGWPRRDWWDPEYPALLDTNDLIWLFARAGDLANAKALLRELLVDQPVYTYGFYRVDRSIPGFVCDPEVQAMLGEKNLPPLTVPYPCP
jgi:TolB-like protein